MKNEEKDHHDDEVFISQNYNELLKHHDIISSLSIAQHYRILKLAINQDNDNKLDYSGLISYLRNQLDNGNRNVNILLSLINPSKVKLDDMLNLLNCQNIDNSFINFPITYLLKEIKQTKDETREAFNQIQNFQNQILTLLLDMQQNSQNDNKILKDQILAETSEINKKQDLNKDEIQNEINSIKNQLSTNQTDITNLIDSKTRSVSDSINNIYNNQFQNKMQDLSNNILSIQSQVLVNNAEINSIKNQLSTNQIDIKNLIDTKTRSISDSINNIYNNQFQNKMQDLSNNIQSIQSQVSTNNTEINSIKNQLSTNQTDITNLIDSKTRSVSDSINNIYNNQFQNKIQDLSNNIQSIQSQVSSIHTKLDSQNSNIILELNNIKQQIPNGEKNIKNMINNISTNIQNINNSYSQDTQHILNYMITKDILPLKFITQSMNYNGIINYFITKFGNPFELQILKISYKPFGDISFSMNRLGDFSNTKEYVTKCIEIDFQRFQYCYKGFQITCLKSDENPKKNYIIEGSDTGLSWKSIQEFSCKYDSFSIPCNENQDQYYRYFRIRIKGVHTIKPTKMELFGILENRTINPNRKRINILCVLPSERQPINYSFIDYLNQDKANTDYFIHYRIIVHTDLKKQLVSRNDYLNLFDIVVLGGCDSYESFSKSIDQQVANLLKVFHNQNGIILLLHDNSWNPLYNYFSPFFDLLGFKGNNPNINGPNYREYNRVIFKEKSGKNDLISIPFNLGKEFPITPSHYSAQYDPNYIVLSYIDNSAFNYYTENLDDHLADCQMGHNPNINDCEQKFFYNAICHLYNSCKNHNIKNTV